MVNNNNDLNLNEPPNVALLHQLYEQTAEFEAQALQSRQRLNIEMGKFVNIPVAHEAGLLNTILREIRASRTETRNLSARLENQLPHGLDDEIEHIYDTLSGLPFPGQPRTSRELFDMTDEQVSALLQRMDKPLNGDRLKRQFRLRRAYGLRDILAVGN